MTPNPVMTTRRADVMQSSFVRNRLFYRHDRRASRASICSGGFLLLFAEGRGASFRKEKRAARWGGSFLVEWVIGVGAGVELPPLPGDSWKRTVDYFRFRQACISRPTPAIARRTRLDGSGATTRSSFSVLPTVSSWRYEPAGAANELQVAQVGHVDTRRRGTEIDQVVSSERRLRHKTADVNHRLTAVVKSESETTGSGGKQELVPCAAGCVKSKSIVESLSSIRLPPVIEMRRWRHRRRG